jgi:hypothetical protein
MFDHIPASIEYNDTYLSLCKLPGAKKFYRTPNHRLVIFTDLYRLTHNQLTLPALLDRWNTLIDYNPFCVMEESMLYFRAYPSHHVGPFINAYLECNNPGIYRFLLCKENIDVSSTWFDTIMPNERIWKVRLKPAWLAARNALYTRATTFMEQIKEELIATTWEPTRTLDWCLDHEAAKRWISV